MRIYADSLKPNIPYKTILLSTRDTADFAVVEALEKYGLEKENPREYCIARVTAIAPPQPLHVLNREHIHPSSPMYTKRRTSSTILYRHQIHLSSID